MDRDFFIVQALVHARREIARREDRDDLCTIDLINMAVDYGSSHGLTFEEIDDALGKPLIELICV